MVVDLLQTIKVKQLLQLLIFITFSHGRSVFKYWQRCCRASIQSRHPGPAIHDILWGQDLIGLAESNGMRFDPMHHFHRLMKLQISICAWMTGIFQHKSEGG